MKKSNIMFKQILPNVMSPVIVSTTTNVAFFILQEAALSFIGLGVADSTPTWGNILNAAKSVSVVTNQWWIWVFPGLAISLFVLAINFFGDGLRMCWMQNSSKEGLMDSKEYILNVEKLNTSFISDRKEIKIVKDVSFRVRRGKTMAVVGESGCGKSVTMNSIMRFTGRNAIVKADSIQYNALRNGGIVEYHLESIKEPNGPEMRALRGRICPWYFRIRCPV